MYKAIVIIFLLITPFNLTSCNSSEDLKTEATNVPTEIEVSPSPTSYTNNTTLNKEGINSQSALSNTTLPTSDPTVLNEEEKLRLLQPSD